MILIGYAFVILIFLINLKFSNFKIKNSKINSIIFLNISKVSKFYLVFLFFNLFCFICLNLLRNKIKTESTVLNTDEFIDNLDKLNRNEKIFYFAYEEGKLFKEAPTGSFLYKLYYRKVIEEKKFSTNKNRDEKTNFETLKFLIKSDITSFFFFSNKNFLLVLLAFITINIKDELIKNLFAFLKSSYYFETLNSFYMRKNLIKNLKLKINER